MKSQVRFGLTGGGRIAPNYVKALARVPHAWLACAYDLGEAKARAVAGAQPSCARRSSPSFYARFVSNIMGERMKVLCVCGYATECIMNVRWDHGAASPAANAKAGLIGEHLVRAGHEFTLLSFISIVSSGRQFCPSATDPHKDSSFDFVAEMTA